MGVGEKSVAFYQYLTYSHKSATAVFNILYVIKLLNSTLFAVVSTKSAYTGMPGQEPDLE